MIYFGLLALAVGLGVPIAVLSAARGQGDTAKAMLEGIARQPEASGQMFLPFILGLAFIESLVIYAFVMFFILSSKLPTVPDAVKGVAAQSGQRISVTDKGIISVK